MSRMSIANVKRGRLVVPPKVMIYGIEGVGKSTFAAGAPKPLFLPFDNRTSHLDVARLPKPDSWTEALEAMTMLGEEKHSYETLIVDPVNWLESLLHEMICAQNGWKSISDPGYGKGPEAAFVHWRVFLSMLERIWHRGMGVVLIAHAQVKTFNNPEGSSFDRYEPSLDKKSAGMFKAWCDHVLFAREMTSLKVTSDKKARGVSAGVRLMHTAWNAAYDAKFSGSVQPILPLSWAAFADALDGSSKKADALRTQIDAGVRQINDPAVEKKVSALVAEAKDNVDALAEIANAVAVKIREMESEEEHEST